MLLCRPRQIRRISPVAQDVFFVEGPDSNWTILTGASSVTLIDCGYPNDIDLVEESIRAVGVAPGDLRNLLITHGHADHIGSARELMRRHQVHAYASPAEIPNVRRDVCHQVTLRDVLPHLHKPRYTRWLISALQGGGTRPVAIDLVTPLRVGLTQEFSGHPVLPVETAGHTLGHTAFWLPKSRLLVSGDALISSHRTTTSTEVAHQLPDIFHADPCQASITFDRIASADSSVILPGHGPVLCGRKND